MRFKSSLCTQRKGKRRDVTKRSSENIDRRHVCVCVYVCVCVCSLCQAYYHEDTLLSKLLGNCKLLRLSFNKYGITHTHIYIYTYIYIYIYMYIIMTFAIPVSRIDYEF